MFIIYFRSGITNAIWSTCSRCVCVSVFWCCCCFYCFYSSCSSFQCVIWPIRSINPTNWEGRKINFCWLNWWKTWNFYLQFFFFRIINCWKIENGRLVEKFMYCSERLLIFFSLFFLKKNKIVRCWFLVSGELQNFRPNKLFFESGRYRSYSFFLLLKTLKKYNCK